VPPRTHRHDVWGVDRRRERLERSALVVVECRDWFEVNAHRPSDSSYSVEQSRLSNAAGERRPTEKNARNSPKSLCCGPSAPLG
jgi:hypothetical protein